MAFIQYSRFVRRLVSVASACAALLIAGCGLSLLFASLRAHGSIGGSTLLFLTGLILLALSPVAFIVAVMIWTSQPT